MSKSEIGLIGLAVMGVNLALNIADKGFKVSVFNRTLSKVDEAIERSQNELKDGKKDNFKGFQTIGEFVDSLSTPRKIIIMVKAGAPVDMTIEKLVPLLSKGDLIIDGGNEYFKNTEERAEKLKSVGIQYMGMGVSGGEEGARYGPSLMPGGPLEAYNSISHILTKIAAQVEGDGACVTHIGTGGAGNYVKMIHNGIEYGDMQLIAEVYDVLKNIGGLTNDELHKVFAEWNDGELQSFLVEITSTIFSKKDDKKDGYLLDKVLDQSGSKGTGKWTVQEAAYIGVACPTIASALDSRYISTLKEERVNASKKLLGPSSTNDKINKETLIKDCRNALYASKICSYAQGMNILKEAGLKFNWKLQFGEIARIWKGGCIIRAVFLDRIKDAYKKNAELSNLLMDDEFAKEINDRQDSWRRLVVCAVQNGLPVPALSSSLAYYDAYRRERLPANLIQSQRDFFGAHTYNRTDMEGTFHSQWSSNSQ